MSRQAPTELARKLKLIREHLNLTLEEMAQKLGRQDSGRRSRVYEWEVGKRQPDYLSLLAYARLVDVSTDVLIDDDRELDLKDMNKGI